MAKKKAPQKSTTTKIPTANSASSTKKPATKTKAPPKIKKIPLGSD